jgi:arabinan endo-1,5-alpha-L-arabinosidase
MNSTLGYNQNRVYRCAQTLLLSGWLAVLSASSVYVNPLSGDIGVHDPVMIKSGSTYYLFSTGNRVGAKTSTNRIAWKNVGSALGSIPAWVIQEVPAYTGSSCWAPDISFRNNQYWLYYSVSVFGKNTSAIGLATSPSLASQVWTDQGMVVKSISSNNYNCIDPNAFEDTDGKLWLTFGSWWSGIKLVELDPATGKPKTATPTLIALAQHTAGIEAPFIIKWGSYYYLFVSWDVCCDGVNSTYKIVAGRATKVDGPYSDKTGKTMASGGGTILDTGDAVRKGPGHNGIFIENDTVFCVNHYYDATADGDSKLQIRPLYWDNGWPTFTKTITAVRQAADFRPANRSEPRVVFRESWSGIRSLEGRVYTISGKKIAGELFRGSWKNAHSVLIVDTR